MILEPTGGEAVTGRYMSVWRKSETGAWQIAAYVHNGAWAAPIAAPAALTRYNSLQAQPSDRFADARSGFPGNPS